MPDRNIVGEGFETGPDMGVGSKKKEEGSFNFMRESLGQRRQSKESEVKVKAGSRVSRTSGAEKRGDINGLKKGERKETTKGFRDHLLPLRIPSEFHRQERVITV